MSVLSVIQPSPDEQQMRPTAPASDLDVVKSKGWWDSTIAAAKTGVDEVPFVQGQRLDAAYLPVIAAMADATGRSRFFAYQSPWKLANPLAREKTDFDALWSDIDRLAKAGKLPAGVPTDRAQFESGVLNRNGERQRDLIVAGQGGAGSRLVGGVAAGFADPYMVGLSIATGGASAELSTGRAILTEGVVNAGIMAAETPAVIDARAKLGEQTTVEDVAANLGTAFAFGAVAGGISRAIGAGWRAGKSAIGNPEARSPVEVAKAFAKAVPEQLRTPDQAAALAVIDRDADLAAKNPFEPGSAGEDAHFAMANAAQRRIIDPAAPPPRLTSPGGLARGGGVDAYLAAVRKSESGGNPAARNPIPGQTASGLYGFTDRTWIGTYRASFPKTGLSDGAILALKGDAALQEQLMRRLTEDNAARLQKIGAEVDPANLYIMHHLGTGDGPKVLRAAPETPLADLLSAKVIEVNPHMKGKTVGEFVAWSRKRMGQEAGAIDMPLAGARDESAAAALDAEQLQVSAERQALDRDIEADSAAATPAAIEEPPMPDGMVRVYHAGDAHAAGDTPRLASIDRRAAADAAIEQPLHYVDIAAGDPRLAESNFALSADEAANLIEIRRARTSGYDDVPMLRRDLFDSEDSWRAAQQQVDELHRGADPTDEQLAAADKVIGPASGGWIVRLGDQTRQVSGGASVRRAAAELAQQAGVLDEHFNRIMKWRSREGSIGPVEISKYAEPGTMKAALDKARREQASAVEAMPEAVAARYADPAAAEAKAQADSFTHDVIAGQEAGQFRGVAFAVDGAARETPEQALGRLDDEDAALAALRGCL
jgi:hypothetical protein